MPHRSLFCTLLASTAIVVALAGTARADTTQTWSNVGNIGGPVFWAAGLGSSLLQDGADGKAHAARTFDGLLVAGVTSELLGQITHVRRPDSQQHDAFPSTHATLSFEIASAQSYYHPRQAPFWYAGAALIGYARVGGREHHFTDVFAGAALGYTIGRFAVTSHRGWILSPLFEGGRPGLALSFSNKF